MYPSIILPLTLAITLVALLAGLLLYREKTQKRLILHNLSVQNNMLEAIPDSLYEVDGNGLILHVWALNPNEFSLPISEVAGKTLWQVFTQKAADIAMQAIQQAQDEGLSRGREILIRKQRRDFWFELSVSRKQSRDDAEDRFIILSRDITLRKFSENQLSISANVFRHAREGIIITDAQCNIIDINDSFTQITGYNAREAHGKSPKILQSGYHTTEFYAAMWQEIHLKGHWYGEITNKRKNGEIFVQFLSITTTFDQHGQVKNYVGIFADITQQKENQKKLEHIAHYDALTQLPNRVLLGDRLNQHMIQTARRKQYLAVVFLDLDGFKDVNDQFGHQTGDTLLTIMAKRLKHALREGDTIARIGGDEFIAVLTDLNHIDHTLPYLANLLKSASTPVDIAGNEIQLSASLGVSFYSGDEHINADLLIRQADQAMYQAKLAGKNQYYIFDSDKDQVLREKYEDLESLNTAIKNNQFILHYQPKVNMRTGEILGVEALVRWQHPTKGLLLPGDFLPVLEESPLAIDLGEWVIETALKQGIAWNEAGLKLPISVNISANHLQHFNFTHRLHEILSQHSAIKQNMLEIEVLETNALADISQVSRIIKDCHDMGVDFALDDFGTGYSSLSYLKRLPVKLLKIDRNFVKDMLIDPDDLSILEGIISMASAFHLKVLAEGVESTDQGRLLLQLGCENAQGFFIARPMPAEQVPNWLKNWQPDTKWLNQPPVNRDDIPLLVAEIEHNAWIKRVLDYLDDRNAIPAEIDHHQCRFGQWLDDEGRKRYHQHSNFTPIVELHEKVHQFVIETIASKSRGKNIYAETRQISLYKQELIEKLNQMLKINYH
jgi:diguanylate cyclase (GGDEF)-like protein/PAS domain S-box-containing protein